MSADDEVVFPVEVTVVRMVVGEVRSPVFPVQHRYVEMLWLPVIGPSATWMLRRLGAWAAACPDGAPVLLPELSEALGLGGSSGASSSVQRTLRRLVRFGLARWSGSVLEVATEVPLVPDRQLRRMSLVLVRAHDRMVAAIANERAA